MQLRFAPAAGRFRFSLRTLLIAVTVVGLGMAWVHRAHEQQRAVEALRTSNPGAIVLYDQPHGFVAKWISADYRTSVVRVELFYATDADIEALARFPRLHTVWMERSIDLTDQGLATLAKIKSLRVVVLADAEQITDTGLRHLEALANLEWLQIDLGRFRPSDQAIQSLRRALPRCRIEVRGETGERPDLARMN